MELQSETIEKIVELADPCIAEINGTSYLFSKSGDKYEEIIASPRFPGKMNLNSLDSLLELVRTEATKRHTAPFYLVALAHNNVKCYTQPLDVLYNERAVLYDVTATDIPGWGEKSELSFEEALIAIRTRFQQKGDTAYLLKLLSDITNGAKITRSDNGIATSIVTQKGIALQGNEIIRPIVTLRPYRTFMEIEQPSSEFHIRVNERGIKFIEADGGMWKLAARRTIVEYLKDNLTAAVEDGSVIVTL